MDLMAALVDGPGTCAQLAQRTGLAVSVTRTALDNMVRRGDASSTDLPAVRVPGCNRPVPVYSRAVDEVGAAVVVGDEGGARVRDLIAAWAGLGGVGGAQRRAGVSA